MDILNGDGFYRHYIFYRLLLIDLHEFYHYYHFKVLNALSPFTIFTMYCCMKCVECITALFLCIVIYTCFVRNDEIKMSNQSIKMHNWDIFIQENAHEFSSSILFLWHMS